MFVILSSSSVKQQTNRQKSLHPSRVLPKMLYTHHHHLVLRTVYYVTRTRVSRRVVRPSPSDQYIMLNCKYYYGSGLGRPVSRLGSVRPLGAAKFPRSSRKFSRARASYINSGYICSIHVYDRSDRTPVIGIYTYIYIYIGPSVRERAGARADRNDIITTRPRGSQGGGAAAE